MSPVITTKWPSSRRRSSSRISRVSDQGRSFATSLIAIAATREERMKITSVEAHLLAVAWDADPNWAFRTDMSTALIRIDTDAGVSGWGESIMGYFAPTT